MQRQLAPLVLLLLALAVLMAACASQSGFVVTAESLNSLGNQFVAVGEAYNKALDAKKITPEEYRAWADFAKKFKTSYPIAVEGWKSGVKVNDAALQKSSVALISSLVGELGKFALTVGMQVIGG
jgi:hypothetical protein